MYIVYEVLNNRWTSP